MGRSLAVMAAGPVAQSLATWVLLALAAMSWWVGVPGIARAAVPIPRVEDSDGLTVGDRSTFHAGVSVPIGIDSNVFSQHRSEDPHAAAYVFPTAWIGIGNRQVRDSVLMSPPERSGRIADYNVSLLAGYRQYLAADPIVRQQSGAMGGLLVRLSLLPGRRFSTDLDLDLYYGQEPSPLASADTEADRFRSNARLTFTVRPGGGRLSLDLGYAGQVLLFPRDQGINARGNRVVNGLFQETKWRFMPRSSIIFRYDFDFTLYLCCDQEGIGQNQSSFAHRFLTGFRGQLAKRLTLDAVGGWGLGFYREDANGPDFSSFIGELALNFYPTLESRIYVSLARSFEDSLWGNYYVDNGVKLGGRYVFRWRMIARLGLALAGRRYFGLPEPRVEDVNIVSITGNSVQGLEERDTIFTLDLGVEQPLGRRFSIALDYNLFVDFTETVVTYELADGTLFPDSLGFNRHLLWLMGAFRI